MPIQGEFKLGDQIIKCEEKDKCLSLYDIGRGHFNYHTNWFWASMTTYLSDGKTTFSLNFGDGLGVEYNTDYKSNEDFVMINGTHYKLD